MRSLWNELRALALIAAILPGCDAEPAIWREPLPAATIPGTSTLQVAVDGGGNALLFWGERNGFWSIRLVEDQQAEPLGVVLGPDAAQLAMEPSGNGLAIWSQDVGGRFEVQASRYTPDAGWNAPVSVDGNAGHPCSATTPAGRPLRCGAVDPTVALDANGHGFAAWQADDDAHTIWASRYDRDAGFAPRELVWTTLSVGLYSAPQVAVDGAGNAFVVWTEGKGEPGPVWVNRYAAGVGWEGATRVDGARAERQPPFVAASAQGDAVLVWRSRRDLHLLRYTPGTGWGATETVNAEEPIHFTTTFDAGIDDQGEAILVWRSEEQSIWAAHNTRDAGFTRQSILEEDGDPAEVPRVAVNGSGEAVAVWAQRDSDDSVVRANRYTPDGGWLGDATIESTSVRDPKVGIGADGTAVIAWQSRGGGAATLVTSRSR